MNALAQGVLHAILELNELTERDVQSEKFAYGKAKKGKKKRLKWDGHPK